MPVSEIVEGVFKLIWIFLNRMFVDMVFEFLFYWIGRIFLKTISLGKYPKDHFGDESDTVCSFVGLALVVGIAIYFIAK